MRTVGEIYESFLLRRNYKEERFETSVVAPVPKDFAVSGIILCADTHSPCNLIVAVTVVVAISECLAAVGLEHHIKCLRFESSAIEEGLYKF